jgi:nucleotide-binding universal stress UspA family protein
MQRSHKILLNLDLSELDASLMQYASYLSEHLDIREMVLVHNMLISEPPEELLSLYPELDEPLENIVRREIEENLDHYFSKPDFRVEIRVFKNEKMDDVIRWVGQQEVDISLVGKKKEAEGQGWYSRQFTRFTSHSVILVPPLPNYSIRNILAAVDFSKNAVNVIRSAHELAMDADANLSYLHLYAYPPKYFPYIPQNMDKYRAEYMRYAKKEFENWKKKSIGQKETGTCHFQLSDRQDIARELYLWAVKHRADLIVCGAKGKSDTEMLLLGSVSEKLIHTDYNIPLMVVKRKENYSWLESLLS